LIDQIEEKELLKVPLIVIIALAILLSPKVDIDLRTYCSKGIVIPVRINKHMKRQSS